MEQRSQELHLGGGHFPAWRDRWTPRGVDFGSSQRSPVPPGGGGAAVRAVSDQAAAGSARMRVSASMKLRCQGQRAGR